MNASTLCQREGTPVRCRMVVSQKNVAGIGSVSLTQLSLTAIMSSYCVRRFYCVYLITSTRMSLRCTKPCSGPEMIGFGSSPSMHNWNNHQFHHLNTLLSCVVVYENYTSWVNWNGPKASRRSMCMNQRGILAPIKTIWR